MPMGTACSDCCRTGAIKRLRYGRRIVGTDRPVNSLINASRRCALARTASVPEISSGARMDTRFRIVGLRAYERGDDEDDEAGDCEADDVDDGGVVVVPVVEEEGPDVLEAGVIALVDAAAAAEGAAVLVLDAGNGGDDERVGPDS